MGCRGVKCVHVTAQGIVIRRRLSRVMHAAENPIPPMSFLCCHAPSHIHVPTWVDVTVCKSPVSGVLFFFFCIHMFKNGSAESQRYIKTEVVSGPGVWRVWTQSDLDADHDLLSGKDEATLGTMVATPVDMLVIPPLLALPLWNTASHFLWDWLQRKGLIILADYSRHPPQRKVGQRTVTSVFTLSLFGNI